MVVTSDPSILVYEAGSNNDPQDSMLVIKACVINLYLRESYFDLGSDLQVIYHVEVRYFYRTQVSKIVQVIFSYYYIFQTL